jgi:AraC-like DNA-binding protein/ketosteroid isomerase-like protein
MHNGLQPEIQLTGHADTAEVEAGTQEVILAYHRAWKHSDLEAILALYHPELVYYDFLQNRVFRYAEMAAYVAASLPHENSDLFEYTDRIRVDGDTAFIQYRMVLSGGDGPVSFCSSEAITVSAGLICQVREYTALQHEQGSTQPGKDGRTPLQRLGLSARQLGRIAEDLHSYFSLEQPFLDPACNLQSVAKATGYSRNQISYLLNQVLSISFYRYVNKARLDYLLGSLNQSDTGERIDQLAFSAGFNSLSAFYRCFREHTGQSPGNYLESLRCGSAHTTIVGKAR